MAKAQTKEPVIHGMPASALVRAPTRSLTNAQRRAQKSARLVMLRRWWASGFEIESIRQMAHAHFDITDAAITRLLRAVADAIDAEAEAYEQVPDHLIRHRHRIRFEQHYRRCVDKGAWAAAERCLRALAELDGAFRVRDDDGPKLVVSIHQQGARFMTDEQLAARLLADDDDDFAIDVPLEADE